jgi:TetR/AcrR family transcriptional repressor of nem operon
MPRSTAKTDARTKLLEAALSVIRTKGYSATSVDELCAAAGVTKGAFFHHFKSKDELGVAAADHWSETTGALFADAPYHDHAAPLDRVLGYLEFRNALLQGGVPEFTCLVGTMVQETYETTPAIREACERSITGHAATLEADIEAAMRERRFKGAEYRAVIVQGV